ERGGRQRVGVLRRAAGLARVPRDALESRTRQADVRDRGGGSAAGAHPPPRPCARPRLGRGGGAGRGRLTMRPHVTFVFLDGVGLGPAGPENPLATLRLPAFERLAGGQRWTTEAGALAEPDHVFHPLDATLGLDGLPQSGTGQASLFTGVNCAARAGRHWGPYPHSTSKPVIAAKNLFVRLREA